MTSWSDAVIAAARRSRGRGPSQRFFAAARKLEAMSEERDGQRSVTFTQKAFGDAAAREVSWAARTAGLMLVGVNRGRLGNEYRLLLPAERNTLLTFCTGCDEWVYKTSIAVPDVLAAYLLECQYGYDGLVRCNNCRADQAASPRYLPGRCAGCGAIGAPCAINGRAVCAFCLVSVLSPQELNEALAGCAVTIDLEVYAGNYFAAVE